MDKILVSACFLGDRVRYNGLVKTLENKLVQHWQQQERLISICPEVISGLAVPRPAAEINQMTKQVITINSVDVTEHFNQGAQQALLLCQRYKIKYALLKESSPSCGSTTIYDGTFTQQKISGAGITTQLLRKNNIEVYSEETIELLAQRINASDQTS